MPAADASLGQMPADQSMGGAAPMDPSMGGMPADPNMGGAAPMDPSMGGMSADPSMGGGDEQGGGVDDSTMSLMSQLSQKDRETVRAYIISILNGNTSNGGTQNGQEPEQQGMQTQEQMPQQVAEMINAILSKKQLSEIFREKGKDKDKVEKVLDKHNNNKKSPWATPNFNKK